jgi:hypothetical protein
MLERIQVALLKLEQNFKERQKNILENSSTREEIGFPNYNRATRSTYNRYIIKSIKDRGQILFINILLKDSFLVSCRQIMSQAHSKILSLTASHFLSELIPLTFHHKIFQVLVAIKDI